MWRILVRRIAFAIPTLFVVYTITFALTQLIPGSPGATILGEQATPSAVATLNHQLGYDRPLITQFASGLGKLVRGDLGTSLISGRPVSQDIAPRLPVTLSVAIGGILVSLALGIVIGLISAIRGGWVDRTVQTVSNVFTATPGFWLSILLVLTFAIGWPILPATGWTPFSDSPVEWARGLVLPVAAVGLAGVAGIARQLRGALVDTLQKDYVRTLRASGVSNRSLLLKHGLRNAAIPVVSNVGFRFVAILGGAVVIEQVFSLPGIGPLTLSAVNSHDLPEIQGTVLSLTIVILLVNLAIDLVIAWLNPRSRTA